MLASDLSGSELVVVIAAALCCVGFAALAVVLVRMLDALRTLKGEIEALRADVRPLLVELSSSAADARVAVEQARHDLDRFDRVLGSAEAISDAVAGGGRVARAAFSTPVIKTVAIGTGAKRAFRRLLRGAR